MVEPYRVKQKPVLPESGSHQEVKGRDKEKSIVEKSTMLF